MNTFGHADRRGFLAGSSALLLAGLAGVRPAMAAATVPVTTAFGWISNVEYAGFWTALEKGYFTAEGIEADYLSGGPNAPDTLVSLSSDAAQIATANWLPILDARAKGNDFMILGAQWATSPAAIMSMPSHPILKPEDLVGAKILAQNPTDTIIIDSILKGAGLPLDYTTLQTGFSPEPLLAGDGDGYLAFATNQPITFENMGMTAGKDFHVTLLADLGYDVKQGLVVARRDYVAANRDLLVGYFRALIRGWKDAIADPAAAAQLVVGKYGADLGLDPAQQTRQMELEGPLITPRDGAELYMFDPKVIDGAMTAAAVAAGRTVPPIDDLVDLTLLKDAHASL